MTYPAQPHHIGLDRLALGTAAEQLTAIGAASQADLDELSQNIDGGSATSTYSATTIDGGAST